MAVTEARSHRSTRRGPGGRGHVLPAVTACLTVLAALTVVTTGPASARSALPSHHRPPSRAVFQVGAAAVDVTPPAAGPGVANPAAACATPAQLAVHDGHHLLSLEEPYTDVNHNGIWDVGEPFVDCPTPLVNGGTAPPDGRWDGIYAGWRRRRRPRADRGARPPVGTHRRRPQRRPHGVAHERRQRGRVQGDLGPGAGQGPRRRRTDRSTPCSSRSTHDESAPDTIGITGPNQFTSGVDAFYVEFLVAGAARSIERAATRLTPAYIRYGSVHPDNLGHVLVVVPVRGRRGHRRDAGPVGPRRPRHRRPWPTTASTPRSWGSPTTRRTAAPVVGLAALRAQGARSPLRGHGDDHGGRGRLGGDAPGVLDPAQLRARRRVQLDGQRRLPDHLRHGHSMVAVRLPRCRPRPAASRWRGGPRPRSTPAPGRESGGIDVADQVVLRAARERAVRPRRRSSA